MKKNISYIILAIILFAVINSCTSGRRNNHNYEDNINTTHEKVRGEAYLFDVRLKRDGKPTSFRLEIYQTDTITAFSGRGYLGKGAIKGVVNNDSVLIYFPVSNEYLHASTATILDIKDCVNGFDNLNVFDLLTKLPTEIDIGSNLKISTTYSDADKPGFDLYNPECSWELFIKYDKRKTGWRAKSFFIHDGFDNMIKATRRTYKKNAKIPYKRFIINIPDDAVRIIP